MACIGENCIVVEFEFANFSIVTVCSPPDCDEVTQDEIEKEIRKKLEKEVSCGCSEMKCKCAKKQGAKSDKSVPIRMFFLLKFQKSPVCRCYSSVEVDVTTVTTPGICVLDPEKLTTRIGLEQKECLVALAPGVSLDVGDVAILDVGLSPVSREATTTKSKKR